MNACYLVKQPPHLRKQNKIKTIHSSIKIEGNKLSEAQVTAILENKRIPGSQKDIQEVINAAAVYDSLTLFTASSEKSFLKAHKLLMENLLPDAGKYRRSGVGIVKGKQVKHIAPPYMNVPGQMKDLFRYIALIKLKWL